MNEVVTHVIDAVEMRNRVIPGKETRVDAVQLLMLYKVCSNKVSYIFMSADKNYACTTFAHVSF
jgi:hypothetical protein